jgi:hypothetical protein
MDEEEYLHGLDDDDELDGNIMAMSSNQLNNKVEANWSNILQFLKDKQREYEMKETEWMIEKQKLQQKIGTLEAQNKAYDNSNND